MGGEKGDRYFILRFRRSGFVDGEGRSLFDVGNRRSGFMGGEKGDRCLMLGEIGDRVLLVMSGDRCLMWGISDRVYGC
jgi:hypothetical protein